LAGSAFPAVGHEGQARGLVPGSILPSSRDLSYARRGPGLDARGRLGLRELHSEANSGPRPRSEGTSVRTEGPWEFLQPYPESDRGHEQRVSRRRLLHCDRSSETVMIDPALRDAHSVAMTDKTLRQFAVMSIVFFGGLACLEGYGRDRWSVAYMLGGLAITVGLLGLVRPQAIRPLFLGLTAVTYPIGWVVSKVLLVTIFYGMFMPLALFFKVIKR